MCTDQAPFTRKQINLFLNNYVGGILSERRVFHCNNQYCGSLTDILDRSDGLKLNALMIC